MKTRHLPRLSGIYWIVNTGNGKMYIGSTADIQKRVLEHRRALQLNVHPSIKLQRAWNKYGEDVFEVSVIELVEDRTQLLAREQYWMDLIKPVKNGYNVRLIAESNAGTKWTEESLLRASLAKAKPIAGFISPDGEQVTIQNMRSFCKEHGLSAAVMYTLALGKSTSHKGWTHVNAKPKDREWINTYDGFIDPEGNAVAPITNLEQFSRERGLDASSMNKVAQGLQRSCNGWTHVNGADLVDTTHLPKHWSEYPGWISPDGEEVTIVNLRQFCADHNLDQSSMWEVMKGKYPQHKGWRYPAGGYTPKQRETRTWYGYVSPEGEQVVIDHLFKFSQEHGLHEGHMSRLRTGERKTHKGWTYNPSLERE